MTATSKSLLMQLTKTATALVSNLTGSRRTVKNCNFMR